MAIWRHVDRAPVVRYGCVMLGIEQSVRVRMGSGLKDDQADGPPLGPGGILALPQEWGAPVDTLPPYTDGRAIPAPHDYHLTLKYGLLPELVDAEDVAAAAYYPEIPGLPTHALVTDILCLGLDGNCIALGVGDMPYEQRLLDSGEVLPTFRNLNQRLSTLPHVDTWDTYVPHVAMGYVHPDVVEQAVALLEATALGAVVSFATGLEITGLDVEEGAL